MVKLEGTFFIIVLLGALLFSQNSQAQLDHHPVLSELSVSWQNANRLLTSEEDSPFWYEEWLPGTIHSIQGHDYSGVKMKFDLLNGRLFIRQSTDSNPRRMNLIHIKSFSIESSDSIFIFRRHLVPMGEVKKPTDVFFIELVTGNYCLLARPEKEAEPDGGNLAQADDRREEVYIDVVKYFVKNSTGKIIPFKNSKKIKTQVFGENLSVLEKYARQNKLRWNKPLDLIRIVDRANQL